LDTPAAPAVEAAPAAAETAAPPADGTDADAEADADADAASTIVPPTVRKIEGPANEPIELSGVAGTAVLKRVLPALGGLVLLLLILRRLGKR
jgi:hypothetical protein